MNTIVSNEGFEYVCEVILWTVPPQANIIPTILGLSVDVILFILIVVSPGVLFGPDRPF